MPAIVDCPTCLRKLRVGEELLGKKVKCPSCGTIFMASSRANPPPRPRPAPPPEEEEEGGGYGVVMEKPASLPLGHPATLEDEDDDEPLEEEEAEEEEAPRRRSGKRRDWEKVRTGITLLLVSLSLMILSVGGMFFGAMIIGFNAGRAGGAGQPPQAQVAALQVIGTIADVLVEAVAIAGYVYCRAVPARNHAKDLATTTLALAAAYLITRLIANVLTVQTGGEALAAKALTPASLVSSLAMLLYVVKMLVFLFFLRGVADARRADGLAQSIKLLTVVTAATLVGALVFTILGMVLVPGIQAAGAGAAPGKPPAFEGALGGVLFLGCCGCITGLHALVAFVWYIVALAMTRGVLSEYLDRG